MPNVNITDLFNSKDKTASSGIGMVLTTTKVFKTIFVLEIRLGSNISNTNIIYSFFSQKNFINVLGVLKEPNAD